MFNKSVNVLEKVENIGDGVKGLGKSAGSKVKDFEKAAGGIKNSSKVGISNAERVKFKNWEYPLSDDLYLKYKNVYDNPKYYNQETGALSWPPNNGFVKGTEKVDILKPGTIIDRYGEPTGEFLAPMGDSYPSRALAPHSETSKHYVYEVIDDLEITSGEIAPWFDQPGGGTQFIKYHPDGSAFTVEELIDNGYLRLIK